MHHGVRHMILICASMESRMRNHKYSASQMLRLFNEFKLFIGVYESPRYMILGICLG